MRHSNVSLKQSLLLALIPVLCGIGVLPVLSATIPLPEHPRPDFQRDLWMNLNGEWEFQFDSDDAGIKNKWFENSSQLSETIVVPFPWGSKLSGVDDRGDIAWYARTVRVPASWDGKRIFLVIGACDWRTTLWLDGRKIGTHQGGYTPFEFELTPSIKTGTQHRLILRVDDTKHPFNTDFRVGLTVIEI